MPRERQRASRPLVGLLGLLLAAAPASSTTVTSARTGEIGFPPITVFTPDAPDVSSQSFGVAQGRDGVVYVANLGGLYAYDGAWWRRYPIDVSVLSVATDARGRVGVGSVDELGVLAPDPTGALRYESLAKLLGGSSDIGYVRFTTAYRDGFLFLAERRLLYWTGAELITVASFPEAPPSQVPSGFRVGDAVYVWSLEGLRRVEGTRLVPTAYGEQFANRPIRALMPADGGGLIVGLPREGLRRLDAAGDDEFAPLARDWVRGQELTGGCRLADGRYVLGSRYGGVLLLSGDGNLERQVNTSYGLPDDYVRGLLADREGGVWLALEAGIARLETSSPLSSFDSRAGLKGSVNAIERHAGTLFVGTSAGLFALVGDPADLAPGLLPVRQVARVPAGVFALLSVGDELLIGTTAGVYVQDLRGVHAVADTGDDEAYAFLRSRVDPSRVWVGLREGLGSLRQGAAGWRYEGSVEGAPKIVRTIVERSATRLWLGTSFSGLVRLDLAPGDPLAAHATAYGDGEIEIYEIDGQILVPGANGVRRLDEATGHLVDDRALRGLANHGASFILQADRDRNLWMNTPRPVAAVRRADGSYDPAVHSLLTVPSKDIQALFGDADGVVWLGGDKGLSRFAGRVADPGMAPPAPLVHRVTLAGSALVGDTASGPRLVPELPPHARRLRVEFAPSSYRVGLAYQYRLEPLERDWSAPQSAPFAEFTNLPANRYVLRLRSVAPDGTASPETSWSFSVRPAWYETPVAAVLGILVAGLLVSFYARWRNRALAQQASRLAAQVAAQTGELQHTVERLRSAQGEVLEKNRLLEAMNARLEDLSQHDELTGLANRRHLRTRLEQEWMRARRHRQPLALVLFDLDHFKRLNDTLGHAAGDQALVALGAFLRPAVRGEDIVARYGGEEFVLLLPNADLGGGLRVAEGLREGIAQLALPLGRDPAPTLTASFGVAARVPVIGGSFDDLVQEADEAMYRAKAEGRNCVRAAIRAEAAPSPP